MAKKFADSYPLETWLIGSSRRKRPRFSNCRPTYQVTLSEPGAVSECHFAPSWGAQPRDFAKLTETYRACGITNFFASTKTESGLYRLRMESAIFETSRSSSFQLLPSPN